VILSKRRVGSVGLGEKNQTEIGRMSRRTGVDFGVGAEEMPKRDIRYEVSLGLIRANAIYQKPIISSFKVGTVTVRG
jgi:hypothetical protein